MTTVPRFGVLTASDHWRTVDFISDLHLKPEEPSTFDAWAAHLRATPANAVFILGDLFEVWVGDDAAAPGSFEARCGDVLRQAADRLDVFFLRGNRDFLVGPAFLSAHGVHDLTDPTVLSFGGQRWLLTHGDLLCIDDVDYQRFRQQVRSDAWQHAFLTQSLAERQAVARQMRAASQQHHATQVTYADADDALSRQWLAAADATTLIHGHTHRPADHGLGLDGAQRSRTRVVLSDWHIDADTRRAEVLRLTPAGWQRVPPAAG